MGKVRAKSGWFLPRIMNSARILLILGFACSPARASGEQTPVLIIAPALRYNQTQPIFERLAKGAEGLGYRVVRFEWDFFNAGKEPSKGFVQEAGQLSKLIESHRKGGKMVLAAKSFGVKVVMNGPEKLADALLLITPNCDDENTFRKAHAPIFSGNRPVNIPISVADPYCNVLQIHEAMRDLGTNVTLHTLAGDHNFKISGSTSTLNEDAAIQGMVAWLETVAKTQ